MSSKRVLTSRDSALPALAEAFREHGFEGASLAVLSEATGLGKGSLYNFFPGGKEEMMEAVLTEIDRWFHEIIFTPLEQVTDPAVVVRSMIQDVTAYFRSGRRVCLVGSLGLNSAGEGFKLKIHDYFRHWVLALSHCLEVGNVPPGLAVQLAEDAVSGIQGAIVLARALDADEVFSRIIGRQLSTLLGAIASHTGDR